MTECSLVAKASAFNRYLGGTSDRDRVMSVVQFVGMALFRPAAAAGCPQLSANLKTIMELAAQYRAITRFSQWFVVLPQLTPRGIMEVIRTSPTVLIGVCKTLSTALFTVFLIGEEINLFAKYNMLDRALAKKFNRVRFVCIFWSNVARLAANYLIWKQSAHKTIASKQKTTEDQRKELMVADGVLQTIFAYGLLKNALPAGPHVLPLAMKTGNIDDAVAALAPPVVPIDFTPHGIIGLIASVPGFMMSVL